MRFFQPGDCAAAEGKDLDKVLFCDKFSINKLKSDRVYRTCWVAGDDQRAVSIHSGWFFSQFT